MNGFHTTVIKADEQQQANGPEPEDPGPQPGDPKQLPDLVLDSKNRWPVWCAHNCGVVLEQFHQWRGLLAYNELTGFVMLLGPIPGSKTPRRRFKDRPLTDQDVTAAHRWFTRHFHPRATLAVIQAVMTQVAHDTVISPVDTYLRGLHWDGTERLSDWLVTYLGVKPTDFAKAVGRAWLISAVARALKPGCKADYVLILEGGQGVLKSTALRTLAGDDWFFDGLRDFRSKDASQDLRGKWIIELAELAAMTKGEIETTKSYFTRQTERYRPAYGRQEVLEPRRCVFAGSTNAARYLRDPTGNRRYWPVTVGKIDNAKLKLDRDQLWAEAVAAYLSGEQWWLDDAMEEAAKIEVAERSEEDTWSGAFESYLTDNGKTETTVRECMWLGAGVPIDRQTTTLAMRASNVLLSLGWVKGPRQMSGPNRNLSLYRRG